MRAFIAIDVPDEVAEGFATVGEHIKGFGTAEWVKAGQMHLTLSFLGEIDAAQCAAVVACLDALVLGPVTLATEQVGLTVQAHGRVVVWVAVKCPEEFRGAIAQLENRMREIPIAALAKAKPFQPHITLARLKNVRRVGALRKAVENIKLPECAWTAQAITLHQSELRPDGPIYTELHKKTL